MSTTSQRKLGKHSTALEVVHNYGEGKYLTGKVAIVTGGNSGIGLETCKALTYAGCRVILCSRNVENGKAAMQKEFSDDEKTGYVGDSALCEVYQLDLADLDSVVAFSDRLLSGPSALGRIDLLVCNAGIMTPPKLAYTKAGFEEQIGVNHFGHHLLVERLRPLLEKDSHFSRVVALSSIAHSYGCVSLSDMHFKQGRAYSKWKAYGQSKTANILFASALASQWAKNNTSATAVSVHPGVIGSSGLSRDMNWVARTIFSLVSDKTIAQGAACSLFACLDGRVSECGAYTGAYLVDCQIAAPKAHASDVEIRDKFWESSCQQLRELGYLSIKN